MNFIQPGKYSTLKYIVSSFLIMLFLFSCKKSIDTNTDPFNTPPDLSTMVTSTVSGFVTDQNDAPVTGASVKSGQSSTTTDQFGFFEVKNVQVIKNAAVVTVTKTGFFKGIKTYIAAEGKAAFFRIKLLPKTNAGNINAGTGGSVSLTNGLNISLPANAVKNAATGLAYTGTINVSALWIDPTSPELYKIMPGDLRGINTDGLMKGLTTYGMTAVELTGASGELLQIEDGKKSTLTFPVPSSLLATAPATIPLWYFDETSGLWKEQGVASKSGNNYIGEVSHFSFWNCDMPNNYIQFSCTLKDTTGNPIPYAVVKLTIAGTSNAAIGFTDATGFVNGSVPSNAQLLFEAYPGNGYFTCNQAATYSMTVNTTSSNLQLGTVIVTLQANPNMISSSVTGTVSSCNNIPVSNGYIMVREGTQFTRYVLNSSGTYYFTRTLCSNNTYNISIIAEDYATSMQGLALNYTIFPGANDLGNIQACGIPTIQFINFTINGTAYAFHYPADSIFQYNSSTGLPDQQLINAVSGTNPNLSVNIRYSNLGIGINTSQELTRFITTFVDNLQVSEIHNPIFINITEYGAIGQFISGNFSGVVTGTNTVNTDYNVTCNFRVRRRT